MKTPVLIVEDDRGLAELIRDTLTDLGLKSVHADTGKAAMEAIVAQRPPLVLLDFLLPDMSGIEFVTQAAQLPGGMPPFVVTTGAGDERIAVEMMKQGARDYVIKDRQFLDALPVIVPRIMRELETEHKLRAAQTALLESEQRWQFALEGSGDGVWDWNVQDGTGTFSRRYKEMLGFGENEVFGGFVEWSKRIHPEDQQRVQEAHERHFRGETPTMEVEYRLRCKDGAYKWILGRGKVIARDAKGSPLRMSGTHTDITARKASEEELAKTQSQLRAALEQSPAGVIIADAPNITIRLANRAAEEILMADLVGKQGITDNQFYPITWTYYSPDGIPYATKDLPLPQTILAGKSFHNLEMRIVRHDGSERWVLLNGCPIRDAAGHIIAGIIVFLDITERKQSEIREQETRRRIERQVQAMSRLAASEELWGEYFAKAVCPITETVAECLGVERVSIWWTVRDTHEWRCMDLFELTPQRHSEGAALTESEYQDEFHALKSARYVDAHDAMNDPRTAGFREGYLLPNGIVSMLDTAILVAGKMCGVLCLEQVGASRRWQEDEIAFARAIADQVTQVFLHVERENMEDEHRQLEIKIQQAQKLESLGILAGGIAHDFNNLLTAILGNIDLALMDLSPVSPARENLAEADKASRQAAELCKQMLAYSGKGRFIVQAIDLQELVEEMTHILQISISKKVVLKFNFAANLPAIEADATQLRQIIMNLVINASEAVGDRSGVVSISTGAMDCDRAYLSTTWLDEERPEGLYSYIEVADTGCGMDRETLAKIFDPFFTTKFTGRGLGLAAVLGIVRGHKGAIKVYSEVRKGTTFKVLFPALERPADSNEQIGGFVEVWKGHGTVLLVDDEESVRATARRMLERLGFQVVSASDGRAALQTFRENIDRINCVLLDLTMPHMDGEDAFRELRRMKPDVRVIICSGYNEQDVIQRFLGKGLAGFIQKPFNLEKLAEALRKALEAPGN